MSCCGGNKLWIFALPETPIGGRVNLVRVAETLALAVAQHGVDCPRLAADVDVLVGPFMRAAAPHGVERPVRSLPLALALLLSLLRPLQFSTALPGLLRRFSVRSRLKSKGNVQA